MVDIPRAEIATQELIAAQENWKLAFRDFVRRRVPTVAEGCIPRIEARRIEDNDDIIPPRNLRSLLDVIYDGINTVDIDEASFYEDGGLIRVRPRHGYENFFVEGVGEEITTRRIPLYRKRRLPDGRYILVGDTVSFDLDDGTFTVAQSQIIRDAHGEIKEQQSVYERWPIFITVWEDLPRLLDGLDERHSTRVAVYYEHRSLPKKLGLYVPERTI